MTNRSTYFNHIDKLLEHPDRVSNIKEVILANHIVDNNGCWNWTKKLNDRGRAIINLWQRYHNTARASYVVFKLVPIGDLSVCHSCDNVECVNPDHLWLGTTKDNMEDKVAKGRQADQNGTKHSMALLSDNDVLKIRELRNKGLKLKEIAEVYGVSFQHISAIVTKKKWKHL